MLRGIGGVIPRRGNRSALSPYAATDSSAG